MSDWPSIPSPIPSIPSPPSRGRRWPSGRMRGFVAGSEVSQIPHSPTFPAYKKTPSPSMVRARSHVCPGSVAEYPFRRLRLSTVVSHRGVHPETAIDIRYSTKLTPQIDGSAGLPATVEFDSRPKCESISPMMLPFTGASASSTGMRPST